MAVSGILFIIWRVFQIVLLIPPVGMLSWFVHGFVTSNILTPDYVLVLFITSVLALVWAIGTLFLYTRARHAGKFVAFIDLCFMGAFIAGVVVLRAIAGASCRSGTTATQLHGSLFYFNGEIAPGWYKPCNMLKACFAFGIIQILLFFTTFLFALLVGRHWKKEDEKRERKTERHHSSRHSHRRSSRDSRDYSYPPPPPSQARLSNSGRRPYY